MKKPITIAPILLAAILVVSVALAERMREQAWHDRFSFDDSSAIGIFSPKSG